jgi:hypothetical protein
MDDRWLRGTNGAVISNERQAAVHGQGVAPSFELGV